MPRERSRIADHLQQTERLDGLRLPLERERLDRLDTHRIPYEEPRLGADEDLARGGRLLEPGGDVDGVAGDEGLALAADDHLARVDPDPRFEPVLCDGGAHLGRGTSCSQRVVLVRDGDRRRRP